MTIENDDDLQHLKVIGQIVGQTLKKMLDYVEPGMTTRELDLYGGELLKQAGARSAPQLAYGFPGFTCISLNEEAAHGVPGDRIIQAGDMINIDVSAELNGYWADTGGSAVITPGDPIKQSLCDATRLALSQAIKTAKAGAPINHIGKAIQRVAKEKGYRIIRNLCSHGVGRFIHEEPKEIPGYYNPHDKRVLHEGLVITIEPFLSTKSRSVSEAKDGWTLIAPKGNLSAQYEHTMVITQGEPLLLTAV
ncbi:MAG: type I methionyl aminopeptidase [Gammaproteobacteria bacterium]|nr:type I methionyl aminopeptidase [Gammaproteobacteria bacterium]